MRYLRWLLIIWLASILLALFFPWPSPRPFPFSSIRIEAGGGSRQAYEERIYSSSLSLSALKNYYNFQLRFFCDGWYWSETAPDETLTSCTNRRDTDHTFYLSLKPQLAGKVLVTQEDSWNEP